MTIGIDAAIDVGRFVTDLSNNGVSFVGRYYRSRTSHWPALSASEAQLLSSAGINIVSIWEGASTKRSYFSYLSGVDDSTTAFQQAYSVGQPTVSAIYFAVDYDAPDDDIGGPISDYFKGIAAGFKTAAAGTSYYQIGIYGSGAVCKSIIHSGKAEFGWLAASRAWRGNADFAEWNIKQSVERLGLPFNHDSDESRDDYGGFRIAQR